MIDSKNFIEKLQNLGIDFFCGVPDSLMSEFSKSLHFDFHNNNHIIASNEGSALSIGMGYNLSTQKIPLIYLQNSGLGNIVNPYVSLLHKEIYNIPFVLLIGWRGEPNKQDEPQHKVQGRITEDLLKLLEIDYIYFDEKSILEEIIEKIETYTKKKKPLAILVKKDSFKKDSRVFENDQSLSTRSDALKKIIGFLAQKLFTYLPLENYQGNFILLGKLKKRLIMTFMSLVEWVMHHQLLLGFWKVRKKRILFAWMAMVRC